MKHLLAITVASLALGASAHAQTTYTFSNTGLTPDSPYHYRVFAVNTTGSSAATSINWDSTRDASSYLPAARATHS